MDVEWRFDQLDGVGLTQVTIFHDIGPVGSPARRWLLRRVVAPLFIHPIASRTLACMKARLTGANGDSTPVPTPSAMGERIARPDSPR
jgi:hypothetical protein